MPWPAKCASTASAHFGADDPHELLARGAADAREAAERGEQRLAPPRPDPGDVVQLRPQVALVRDCRWNVIAKRCASSRIRWISSSAGLRAPARSVLAIAREEQLFLLRDADRHQVGRARAPRAPRTPPTAGPCRRRSGSGPETARPSRAAFGSAAGRLRASTAKSSRNRTSAARGWRLGGRSGASAPAVSSSPAIRTAERRSPDADPRIRNFRYSARFIRPSSQTTIDATVSAPWIVEMSKHSIRRGIAGSARTARSVSSAS